MKKIVSTLLVLTCVFGLAGCSIFKPTDYKSNEWYSDETLEKCLVSNLPEIANSDYYSKDNNFIYFTSTSEGVREYAKTVYEYLDSQNYKYLGTRGDQKASLAGAFASYYFRDVDSFGECYSQMYSKEYIFVYSHDDDESDGIVFNEIIISSIDSKTIKYEGKDISCNAKIELNYDESYYLKEDIIDYSPAEMILYTWFFRSCIVDGKETVLYDKTENGVVTTDYSLIKFENDHTGEFEFNGSTNEFVWSVVDDISIKVEFSDNTFGTVTFKDDDIIVFTYNEMMFVYEDRV